MLVMPLAYSLASEDKVSGSMGTLRSLLQARTLSVRDAASARQILSDRPRVSRRALPVIGIAGPACCSITRKRQVEQLLAELCSAEPDWSVACLRYFYPVGAHPGGSLGEEPPARAGGAALTGAARARRDVRRHLGLAVRQPERLRHP
jgi:hypothetical protein